MDRLIAFILGLFLLVRVQLVGTISISDLLAILLAPLLVITRPWAFRTPYVRPILVLGLLWLLSQITSDLVNGTARHDYLRGWANIGVILTLFIVFVGLFAKNLAAFIWFLAGTVLSGLYATFIVRASGADLPITESEQFWDLYVTAWSFPAIVLILYHLYRKGMGAICICTALLYGAASMIGGARSHGLIFILAGSLIGYVFWVSKTGRYISRGTVVKSIALTSITFLATFILYINAGSRGYLGENTQQQIESTHNPYNPLYTLMRSRSEFILSAHVIMDRPILGIGSWGYNEKYVNQYESTASRLLGLRVEHSKDPNEPDVMPVHSVLFGAWVFGGVLGAVFWVYVVIRLVKISKGLIYEPYSPIVPIAMIFMAYSSWHVLFSPFGYARFHWPAFMAFLLVTTVRYMNSNYCQSDSLHTLRDKL